MVEQALSRQRKILLALSLTIGLLSVLSLVADLLQIIDTLSSGENPRLTVAVCFVLILAPVCAAAVYFLPHERSIFSFCVVGICFVMLGAFYGGVALRRPAGVVDVGAMCETKPYPVGGLPDGDAGGQTAAAEPEIVQYCRRAPLGNKQSIDLDDPSTRAVKARKDADVTLAGLTVSAAHPGVALAVINGAAMTNGLYRISHFGCTQTLQALSKPPPNDAIDLRDLTQRMAICVRTDHGRIAILWLADRDDDQQNAVFYFTCWKQTPG
jgi:hypothetical protein